jgi:hypothetical protein
MPKVEIKLKYSDAGSFEFVQLLTKLYRLPTNNKSSNLFRRIYNEMKKNQDAIIEEYKTTVLEIYAQRDEKGEIIRPDGDPNGFKPMEDKLDDFQKAQDEFGEKLVTFTWGPIRNSDLQDIKLSGHEKDLLKDLYSDEEGPGVPQGIGF